MASPVVVADFALGPGGAFTATLVFAPTLGGQIGLTVTGTGGGVSAFSILQPGCAPGATFAPSFLSLVSPRCGLLRSMDYMATNDNPASAWANRTTPAWSNWAGAAVRADGTPDRGAPWEAFIELANIIGRDVWVNVPTHADDKYVTSLATLLSSTLDASLTIYVEYSNEIWNWGFQQSHDVVTLANESVHADGDPFRLNYDGGAKCTNLNPPYCWQPRLAVYTAAVRLPALFGAVFGAGNVGPRRRVRPLFASQVAWDDNILQAFIYLEDVHGPPNSLLGAMAGAPYFSPAGAVPPNASVDLVLSMVSKNIAGDLPGAGWDETHSVAVFATLAAYYGLPLFGYEGGPDFSAYSDPSILAATAGAQRDPRFAGLFETYLRGWSSFGSVGLLNHFTASATDFQSQYGNWGLLESMREQVTPKTLGFDAARIAPRSGNMLGISLPATNRSAAYCADAAVNATGPMASCSYGPWGLNCSWLYPLAADPTDIVNGASLSVTAYTVLPVPPAGHVIEACIQGAGAMRCKSAPVPQGGSLGAPIALPPMLLPLAASDAWARGLLALKLGLRGAQDVQNLTLVAFDASIVPSAALLVHTQV